MVVFVSHENMVKTSKQKASLLRTQAFASIFQGFLKKSPLRFAGSFDWQLSATRPKATSEGPSDSSLAIADTIPPPEMIFTAKRKLRTFRHPFHKFAKSCGGAETHVVLPN